MKEFHEMCNDLCCIIGYAELILLEKGLEKDPETYAKKIIHYSDKMKSTIYRLTNKYRPLDNFQDDI